MRNVLSYFLLKAPFVQVYMLQQVEYDSVRFGRWLAMLPDLGRLQKRQTLEMTARAKLTLAFAYAVWGVFLLGLVLAAKLSNNFSLLLGLVALPLVSALGLIMFNSLFATLIVRPREQQEITVAKEKLSTMSAIKIAVLGSYGKTSMKEILATVVSEGKKVAYTPGNKNVLISHARWVQQLTGDEEVLIFEYGEYNPGDIEKLASFSRPDWAVIAGVTAAHLDNYGNIDAIAEDFSDIFKFCPDEQVLVNGDSVELVQRVNLGHFYSQQGIASQKVTDVETDLHGLKFKLGKMKLHSQLVGAHMVGPLCAAIYMAQQLGLNDKQISAGVTKTRPFEHRMQPRELHGAWIIDDSYNGNLEGMKAGLEFLRSLVEAKRKIYVTPGLVEQGELTEEIHIELGQAIAQTQPDKVVLMQNSATEFIREGMETGGFKGVLEIIENPLEYYTSIEHTVASGDVVLMQNDWTDSYA